MKNCTALIKFRYSSQLLLPKYSDMPDAGTHWIPEFLTMTTHTSSKPTDPNDRGDDLCKMDTGLNYSLVIEKAKSYRCGDTATSARQFAFTFLLWVISYIGGLYYFAQNHPLFPIFLLGTAIFTVRLFMIQHDCGHFSYFPSRRHNVLLGRFISIITLTPFRAWARCHAEHHMNSGNLSRRGIGDIHTLTVIEFSRLNCVARLRYVIYRHPLILIVIGPLFLFYVRQRFSYYLPRNWAKERNSILLTNFTLLTTWSSMLFFTPISPKIFIGFHIGYMWIASSIGVWLFYVQHQFPKTYLAKQEFHDPVKAALFGASYYALPCWLHWLTAYIGYHHVHHLDSSIPNYRLPDCHNAIPELQQAYRVTVHDSIGLMRLKLWDEEKQVMTTFS